MDTGKQINAMVVVLLLTVIAVGVYALFDPFRAEKAEDDQLAMSAERAGTTFALNCRLCHGDRGQGGVMGGRLPAAPALAGRPDLQGIDKGAFSVAAFDEDFNFVFNTITCGRAGTFMPTWGRIHGGTLSEEQIRQLTVLITGGNLGADPYQEGGFWEEAQDHADELDAEATDHATLQMPGGTLNESETTITVSNASAFSTEQYIRIDEERMQILKKSVEVERGIDGTEAVAHDSGTAFFRNGDDIDKVLGEGVDANAANLVIDDLGAFAIGEVLQLDDELVRVTDIVTGIPTTGQKIIEEIGRTPHDLFVSGSDGIEVGEIVRLGGELLEVTGIREDGDFDIALDTSLSSSADIISVDDPAFFSAGMVVHAGNEQIEITGAVEVDQVLAVGIGRAQTTISVSGSAGIEVGMQIRMGEELLEVLSIEPATITVERGSSDLDGNSTTAASHNSGTSILKLLAEPEEDEKPEDPDTGQTVLGALSAGATTIVVSGTTGFSVDETYQIGNELVLVTDVEPATLRVERGAGGTDRGEHSRRIAIFDGNLLEVERGVLGTSAASHDTGTSLFFDVLEVEREIGGTTLEDHPKNSELFLGQVVIVERGVLNSDAAGHENGTLVMDFPAPPDAPAVTGATCGQNPPLVSSTPAEPVATPRDDAEQVTVSLTEFQVDIEPAVASGGLLDWTVENDGTGIHNFRVIETDLAPDALPLDGNSVDEEAVDVVGGFASPLQAGDSTLLNIDLDPGNYVLICNVPGHYGEGMFVGFEVTGP